MNDVSSAPDFLIAHPYKHHVFNLAVGCQRSGRNSTLAVPLYGKGLCRLVARLPGSIGQRAHGYKHPLLDDTSVSSPTYWQARKLFSFLGDPRDIERSYDEYLARQISSGALRPRCIVTLQDHLYRTTLAAADKGILVWSDQIINMCDAARTRIARHLARYGVTDLSWDESRNSDLLKVASVITVPSMYVRDGLQGRTAESSRIFTVPYGVDLSAFRPRPQFRGSETVVICRAQGVRKGGHLLLAAIQRLAKDLKRLNGGHLPVFHFLGQIEDNLVPMYRKAEGAADVIIRSGTVPHVDMPNFLASGSLFVMPTLSEGMSLAIPEAMASGLGIISTHYSGVDYLVDGHTGLFADDSEEAVCDALLAAFRRKDEWATWGENSRRIVEDNGWDKYESSIGLLAAQLLDARPFGLSAGRPD